MGIYKAFKKVSLVCISRSLNVIFAIVLLSLSGHAVSAPLPTFSDPNMQACFDEMAAANNWQQAEDVDILICSNRNIVSQSGIDQLPNLVELDLSDNPLDDYFPLFAQAQTLKRLNLSGTSLFDLWSLYDLTELTHLILNDVTVTDADVFQIQQQLTDIVRNNPGITHLSLNGFALNDSPALFDELSPNLVSLELSNTGLQYLPVPLNQYIQLESLTLNSNGITDIGWLLVDLPAVSFLSLEGNDEISCEDLDLLTERLGSNVELIKPTSCGHTSSVIDLSTAQSYGDTQDQAQTGPVELLSDGALRLKGNRWQKVRLPVTITPNTELHFEFKSDTQGEIHGIGVSNNNHVSRDLTYALWGTQNWGIRSHYGYTGDGEFQSYVISIGQMLSGDYTYLTFTMDDDANGVGESVFRNVKFVDRDD